MDDAESLNFQQQLASKQSAIAEASGAMGFGEERAGSNKNRKFVRGLCSQLQFIWQFLITLVISVGFMSSLYGVLKSNHDVMVDVLSMSNNTARIDFVAFTCANFRQYATLSNR
ncbi:MAG: hypothetical protein P4M11_04470 [Candidatus Pacebacteria bacterium]|nr:hypothetical protein [Candidatus Paceibacterota bacterium]